MTVETQTDTLPRIVTGDGMMLAGPEELKGFWTEEQCLRLTDVARRPIEVTDGDREVLSIPTNTHQAIVRYLLFAMFAFLQPRGGDVLFAPLRVQMRPDNTASQTWSCSSMRPTRGGRTASASARTWWSKWSARITRCAIRSRK